MALMLSLHLPFFADAASTRSWPIKMQFMYLVETMGESGH